MASSLIVPKLVVKKPIEQTNSSSKPVENKGINNELIEHIEELFQQLFTNAENSSQLLSFSTIFLQLKNICRNLITEQNHSTSVAFDIFNIILKNYIKLLDIDELFQIIEHDRSIENNSFLRQYFRILYHYELQDLAKQMTSKIRREIFFSLFDQINSSIRIVSYLQNNSSNDNYSCSFILYIILKILNNLNVKLTSNDLEKYQNNLLNRFILFIDEYFIQKKNLRINEQQNDILIQEMLCFICEISDKTLTIPILINTNCLQACLQWLSLSYLDDYEYEYIIYILSNIARHDEGVIILNKSDCAKVVRRFKNEGLNLRIDFIIDKERCLKIGRVLDLILALVVDPDELYIEEINSGIINQVLLLNHITSKSIYFKYRGYHISEPLIALMKLCTNNNIIDYILQQDQYPIFFFVTLQKFLLDIENKKIGDNDIDLDILAIMALANIFWSISFNDQYKNELIQNIYLIKRLEEFRENDIINYVLPYIFIPYQMLSLRRVIDGIWQNLYPSLPSKYEIKPKTICSLMISYSHINIKFCRQLYEMLKKLPELSISVDISNGKYLWKETVQTIEQSDVVLFLLSKDFYYSKSCRQEFIYVTDTLKKLFFPVFIDQNFKPTGWLHQRIARLKYIRFGERDFMDSCEELLSLINENLSMNISLVKNPFDVTKWNDKEIKQWFINNNIILELYEFYHFQNGNELLLYADATLAFPWTKEYERIKLRFEEKFQEQEQTLSQNQFLQFINGLKRL